MLGDAGPALHDSDLMLLGESDVDAVYEACTQVEAAVHRPVNPRILTPEEFATVEVVDDDSIEEAWTNELSSRVHDIVSAKVTGHSR